MEHIIIIGNGIAGVTAARHIRKNSNKRITIISAETDYFFSRTALMYVYMGHMKFEHTQPYENWFWKENRIELMNAYVNKILPDENKIEFEDGSHLAYDKLILATGSIPNKFGWPGQDLKGVQGLVSKQDLLQLEQTAPNNKICKRAVIIGGGLIGVELAEMLHTREIPVTFLVREKGFWRGVLPLPNATMISNHIKDHHIDLREEEELKEILSDDNGHVRAVITKKGEEIPCNLVGLCAGVRPQIEFLKESGIEYNRGIMVNRNLQTNFSNIYAIGDCAEQREPVGERKAVEAVWYTGRMMGEVVAQNICGNPVKWNPGHWFNSAKFFEIEYQTYGWVWNNPKEGNDHFTWNGNDGRSMITIEYEITSRKFIGINTFNIRMRHEVFDKWLNEEQTIDHVVHNLRDACFNPEFFKEPYHDIKSQFSNLLTN
ncbi:FAD-dependent oxidoreductase [Nonlabens tegetincola]|uniref:NAD(P)/FAD-dependent oxidoreductase n=1 Tax=Nonlabens tegetincola TaxID=323273 RepID=UPI000A2080DE|nr:FAD-dependent oxidoreductase [Nonlabens tegetincola]ARN70256.1 FAD-dependent oxidoreductase [Nonlabens tegetincola]